MRGSSRRLATLLVVGAVSSVALLAALDAVRGTTPPADETRSRERTSPRAPRAALAHDLDAAGVKGTLSYVDHACRIHVVRLPTLRELDVAAAPECRVSPAHSPPRAFPISASASAIRRDGSFTFVRGGNVVAWVTGCVEAAAPPCARLVLPRRVVARALGAGSSAEVSVERIAWLDDDRLAAIVDVRARAGKGRTVIAVFERRRLVGMVPWLDSRSARFYVSPRGNLFAVATSGPERFFLLDRDGRTGALADVARNWFGRTSLRGARAIALSPDERWTALA